MDLRDWAIKSWHRLNEQCFTRRTWKYGRSYETGLTQFEMEIVIMAVIDTLVEELANGGELNVARLGRFFVVERPEREIQSNLDGIHHRIPARRVIRFRSSPHLNRLVGTDPAGESGRQEPACVG